MAVFLVTYDLIAKAGETRDYEPLYEAIDKFPNHQALYSVFLVQAATANAIENAITPALRKGDRYFITKLNPRGHLYRVMTGTNEWLKDHPLA